MKDIDIFISKDRSIIIVAEWRGGKNSGYVVEYDCTAGRMHMEKGDEGKGFIQELEKLKQDERFDHIGGKRND
jgi:hypothetical protein